MVVSGFGMVIQFFHFVPFIAIVIVALVSKSATAARQPNTFSITSLTSRFGKKLKKF